jgi:hypothetical protein
MTTSPFAVSAPGLAAMGYHPIPILPPTASQASRGKAPGEFSMGRWQGMSKWQAHRDAPATKFQFDLWMRYPDANVGLVLGSPIGKDRLIAIDVDAVDPDALRDILGALPYSPMVKRGSKGETRFYRASADIKSTPYDGPDGRLVDLLTGFDTRQTVVPPSRHPDGPVYHWLAGPVPADELTTFDADDLVVLEEMLASLGWVPKALRKTTSATRLAMGNPIAEQHQSDTDDIWSETKIAALANLEAWVHDLDVYDLRPARGGYEAVATWRASSTGQPIAARKRNLSIQANGVKDFGVGWTGSAIDLVMEAQGLDQAAATTWLRMRLGLAGEVMVLEQRQNVPVRENSTPKTAKIPQNVPSGNISNTELPDALTRVPGLVGRITDWITDTAARPQRGLALGAALTLVGTAAGRKFGGPTNSGTHLYVLALAPTGAGKDAPLQAISRIMDASTMKAHKGPPQFMSMSAVIASLRSQPLSLCAMDEFGSFLKRINNKRSSNHEQAITGTLRTAWGASFGSFQTPAYAGRHSEEIIAPAMSIYGASTPVEFYGAVEGDDVFNGFLNRFLIISTLTKPAKRDPLADAFDVPDEISRGMIDIYAAGGPLMGASMHAVTANKPAIVVPFAEAQAKRVFDRLNEEIDALELETEMWSRTAEMALRLATIRAIGISPSSPVITVDDMEWGRDLASWSARRMAVDAADYMSVNDHQAMAMRILRVIKERVRIKHGDLLRAMQSRLKARDLKEHVQALQESGQVSVEAVRPEAGGTMVQWYSVA